MKSCDSKCAFRCQKGTYTIWTLLLIPVLVASFAFSVDVGKYHDVDSQAQTVADSAALAGINVLRRVFDEDLTTIPAVCKAGFISEAVNDAITRMAADKQSGGMGFTIDDVDLIYCPRSAEQLISGGGPCYVIPANATCDADCDCGAFASSISSYTNESTSHKPGKGFYPLDSEMAGSGVGEEDTAGYIHVLIKKNPKSYFSRLLGVIDDASAEAQALGRHQFKPSFSCPGMYAPIENTNDPEPVNLNNNSRLTILNGGITIRDEVQNSVGSSNPPNSINADWIKIWGNVYSGQITYTCDPRYSPCPQVVSGTAFDNFSPIEQDEYLASQYAIRSAYCNSSAYLSSCTPVNIAGIGNFYFDCTIAGAGPHPVLQAGTYCGGLTIKDVRGTVDNPGVILSPRLANGEIADDVFYMIPRDLPGNEFDTPGLFVVKGWKQGQSKRYSYVEVGYDNTVPDAGIIIYAPVADGSEYAVDMTTSRLNADPGSGQEVGMLRIHSDNLKLDDSELTYKTYTGGEGCDGEPVVILPFSGLVQ